AFAAHRRRKDRMRWIALDWDNWTFEERLGAERGTDANQLAMTPDEGAGTFLRVLCDDACAHAVVSTSDLQARLDQWVYLNAGEERDVDSESLYSRPDLSTELVLPRDPTEKAIAGIWQEMLGIADIGVKDNFFELGGHSILATQVVARIRTAFATELAVRVFFENPTIEQLAHIVPPIAEPAVAEVSADTGTPAQAEATDDAPPLETGVPS
ncbi:MAG TPA: phosphopantetheine-binding protein, partial [Xanthomonadales bacterium]|nr:phosphopantetheine-binding protein [Xanthomonadales bacterium]